VNKDKDEFHGQGGAYIVRDGKRVRVEDPTKDHPDGNRARDKDGNPIEEKRPEAPAKPKGGAK
jgi:hypothetical protein